MVCYFGLKKKNPNGAMAAVKKEDSDGQGHHRSPARFTGDEESSVYAVTLTGALDGSKDTRHGVGMNDDDPPLEALGHIAEDNKRQMAAQQENRSADRLQADKVALQLCMADQRKPRSAKGVKAKRALQQRMAIKQNNRSAGGVEAERAALQQTQSAEAIEEDRVSHQQPMAVMRNRGVCQLCRTFFDKRAAAQRYCLRIECQFALTEMKKIKRTAAARLAAARANRVQDQCGLCQQVFTRSSPAQLYCYSADCRFALAEVRKHNNKRRAANRRGTIL